MEAPQTLALGSARARAAGPGSAQAVVQQAVKPAAPVSRDPRRQPLLYCLALAELARSPARIRAPGLDYCASRPQLLSLRDTGTSGYSYASISGAPALVVTAPVYAGNAVPRDAETRLDTFVGWLHEVMLPDVMIGQALKGRPGETVVLAHASHGSTAVYASGPVPAKRLSAGSYLRNGWGVRIFAPAPGTAVLGDRDARWVLIGGCLLSALLGLMILLLGTRTPISLSPGRAPGPAEELYDALTGLPTRALTMDRAERMIARAGRQSGLLTGAVLIDIDWFEDINEKLGVQAGDQACWRSSPTVSRKSCATATALDAWKAMNS